MNPFYSLNLVQAEFCYLFIIDLFDLNPVGVHLPTQVALYLWLLPNIRPQFQDNLQRSVI